MEICHNSSNIALFSFNKDVLIGKVALHWLVLVEGYFSVVEAYSAPTLLEMLNRLKTTEGDV